ncbi:MAG: putative Na+/H+ antiporter [Polyangiales bacterium]
MTTRHGSIPARNSVVSDRPSSTNPAGSFSRRQQPFIRYTFSTAVSMLAVGWPAIAAAASGHAVSSQIDFPPTLDSYADAGLTNVWAILRHRIEQVPFNLWATLLFAGAIVHTFMTYRFRHIAHVLEKRHQEKRRAGTIETRVSSGARVFHFLGEPEAVFGIWTVPLFFTIVSFYDRPTAVAYINEGVNFTEAVFVVVIMTIASTRPILELAEKALRLLARLGGETPVAWWLVLLVVGSLLGSLITEPAAMTICASLLAGKFYARRPAKHLAYGTLGLLFVAISVGGTWTNFAAPPVLMVADAWGWTTRHMATHFGWKAMLGVLIATAGYYVLFRRELHRLGHGALVTTPEQSSELPIPWWVTLGHLLFMVSAILNSHNPKQLIFVMLFFLAFVEVTDDFQRNFTLRPSVMVGFFLAGLVIHGGLQQWWIAPVLGSLSALPLALGTTVLTAFNDNAAITYLCTLVPTMTEGMKYAAVAGAVTGGGLTVIANAPNPAGQSILGKHFEGGISAAGLLAGALLPTLIVLGCFIAFH